MLLLDVAERTMGECSYYQQYITPVDSLALGSFDEQCWAVPVCLARFVREPAEIVERVS